MVVCLSLSDGRCLSGHWGLIDIRCIGYRGFSDAKKCLNLFYRYYGMGSGYIYLHLSFYWLHIVDKTCRSSVLWHMKMYGVSLVGVKKC